MPSFELAKCDFASCCFNNGDNGYSRTMHGLKSAIDRGADACARSLPGRVLDRYVSRNGPLLANGLAYGLLFAFLPESGLR